MAPGSSAAEDVGGAPPGPRARHPHAAYLEILGKNGEYGLGYDYALSERFGVGGSFAYFTVESQQVVSVAPYANLYPVSGGWGALLVQAGAQWVHVSVPSLVAGWSGTSASGVAGQVSLGYEYRERFLFRFLASAVFGVGGVRPWPGLAFGGAF